MSKRNLIIAAVVLVCLAVVSQWLGNSGKKVTDDKIGKPPLAIKTVDEFDTLVLKDAEGTLHLKKQDEQWVIEEKNDYPVNMKEMLSLMDKLTANTVASLVTKDEKRHAYFQVVYWEEAEAGKETSGTQLTLLDQGEPVFRMIAGKTRQSKSDDPNMPAHADGVYARIGDSPNIYLLKDALSLTVDPAEWIRTTLFAMDKKEVKSIRLELPTERLLLERPEKGKAPVLSDLKETEKMDTFERDGLLDKLEEFTIEDAILRSKVDEDRLQLKGEITISSYDSPDLTFRILQTPVSAGDDTEEAEYYVSFLASTDSGDAPWASVFQLNRKWLFTLDQWKAESWLTSRKDLIDSSSD